MHLLCSAEVRAQQAHVWACFLLVFLPGSISYAALAPCDAGSRSILGLGGSGAGQRKYSTENMLHRLGNVVIKCSSAANAVQPGQCCFPSNMGACTAPHTRPKRRKYNSHTENLTLNGSIERGKHSAAIFRYFLEFNPEYKPID